MYVVVVGCCYCFALAGILRWQADFDNWCNSLARERHLCGIAVTFTREFARASLTWLIPLPLWQKTFLTHSFFFVDSVLLPKCVVYASIFVGWPGAMLNSSCKPWPVRIACCRRAANAGKSNGPEHCSVKQQQPTCAGQRYAYAMFLWSSCRCMLGQSTVMSHASNKQIKQQSNKQQAITIKQ